MNFKKVIFTYIVIIAMAGIGLAGAVEDLSGTDVSVFDQPNMAKDGVDGNAPMLTSSQTAFLAEGTEMNAGQPGEVVREANKVNHPNDNGITSALRKEYEPHRVTVTQANGRTIMEHTNGKIEIYDQGTKAVVQKSGGKRYNYNNVIKALGHFEDLGGFKT